MNAYSQSNPRRCKSDRVALTSIVFAVCLVGFVCASAFFEVVFLTTYDAIPVALQFYAVLAIPALLLAFVYCRAWKLLAYFLGLGFVFALVIIPWHPRKQFVWDLYSIEPGMNIDDVDARMGKYINGMGVKWPGGDAASLPDEKERATWSGTLTYRWNDSNWQYDSDWGQVHFEQGRVVGVSFLPD